MQVLHLVPSGLGCQRKNGHSCWWSNHAVYWVEVVPNMLLFVPSGFMVVDGCNHRCGNNIGIRQTVLCTSDREVLEQVHRCLGTSNSVRQAVIAMLK